MAKVYTLQDVSKHNAINDCWLVIGGKVYDVTEFIEDHPGGEEVLIQSTCKDATNDFEDVGHSTTARSFMDEYYIGDIDASTLPPKKYTWVAAERLCEAEAMMKETEEELAKVKKELEDNKKLVQELQLKVSHANFLRETIEKKCARLELRQWSCMEFTYSELQDATNNFDESLKIGEGGFGTVFKGFLRHTHVAIKIPKQENQLDERSFNQEVETLSKMRHPNLITLMGACRDNEIPALVYEYLPQGSLEDHLIGKNNTPPLSGQIRIRIALEICSALSFLHSTPTSHGDLKPGNILLDSNYVSKLSDFGTCRQLKQNKNTVTPSHLTVNVKGTYAYMDPEYLSSGVMTPRFDVYSFGVVLLQLATGKDVCLVTGTTVTGIRELVEIAIEEKDFDKLVDVEWPYKEAPEKMAKLGLQCFEAKWRRPGRPDASRLFKSLMDIASNK